jgi:hypothetical protein
MTDIRHLFERQAEWQRTHLALSWPEKIRMVEAMRETLRQLRGLPSRRTSQPSRSISPLERAGHGATRDDE